MPAETVPSPQKHLVLRLVVLSLDGSLKCYSVPDGTLLWHNQLPTTTSLLECVAQSRREDKDTGAVKQDHKSAVSSDFKPPPLPPGADSVDSRSLSPHFSNVRSSDVLSSANGITSLVGSINTTASHKQAAAAAAPDSPTGTLTYSSPSPSGYSTQGSFNSPKTTSFKPNCPFCYRRGGSSVPAFSDPCSPLTGSCSSVVASAVGQRSTAASDLLNNNNWLAMLKLPCLDSSRGEKKELEDESNNGEGSVGPYTVVERPQWYWRGTPPPASMDGVSSDLSLASTAETAIKWVPLEDAVEQWSRYCCREHRVIMLRGSEDIYLEVDLTTGTCHTFAEEAEGEGKAEHNRQRGHQTDGTGNSGGSSQLVLTPSSGTRVQRHHSPTSPALGLSGSVSLLRQSSSISKMARLHGPLSGSGNSVSRSFPASPMSPLRPSTSASMATSVPEAVKAERHEEEDEMDEDSNCGCASQTPPMLSVLLTRRTTRVFHPITTGSAVHNTGTTSSYSSSSSIKQRHRGAGGGGGSSLARAAAQARQGKNASAVVQLIGTSVTIELLREDDAEEEDYDSQSTGDEREDVKGNAGLKSASRDGGQIGGYAVRCSAEGQICIAVNPADNAVPTGQVGGDVFIQTDQPIVAAFVLKRGGTSSSLSSPISVAADRVGECAPSSSSVFMVTAVGEPKWELHPLRVYSHSLDSSSDSRLSHPHYYSLQSEEATIASDNEALSRAQVRMAGYVVCREEAGRPDVPHILIEGMSGESQLEAEKEEDEEGEEVSESSDASIRSQQSPATESSDTTAYSHSSVAEEEKKEEDEECRDDASSSISSDNSSAALARGRFWARTALPTPSTTTGSTTTTQKKYSESYVNTPGGTMSHGEGAGTSGGGGGGDASTLPVSSFFDENFDPLLLLGKGVSGAVLLVRHRVTGLFYAVKVLLARDHESEQDVLQEIRVHAMVEHRHLVRYYACWSEVVTPQRARQLALIGLCDRREAGLTFSRLITDGSTTGSLSASFSMQSRPERAMTQAKSSQGVGIWSHLKLSHEGGAPDMLLGDGSFSVLTTDESYSRNRKHAGNHRSLMSVRRSSDDESTEVSSTYDSDDDESDGSDTEGSRTRERGKHSYEYESSDDGTIIGSRVVFLQMEFCQMTLAQHLATRSRIDRVENLIIALQILMGLRSLHQRGILHRDIKPLNIFLDYRCQFAPADVDTLCDDSDVEDERGGDTRAVATGLALQAFVDSDPYGNSLQPVSAVTVVDKHMEASCSALACVVPGASPPSQNTATFVMPQARFREDEHPQTLSWEATSNGHEARDAALDVLLGTPHRSSDELISERLDRVASRWRNLLAPSIRTGIPSTSSLRCDVVQEIVGDEASEEEEATLLQVGSTNAFTSGSLQAKDHAFGSGSSSQQREQGKRSAIPRKIRESAEVRRRLRHEAEWLLRRLVQVRLGDFGLAKHIYQQKIDVAGFFAQNEANTVGAGSPLYSSPEQRAGDVCTAKSDGFSLAMVIAEMYIIPKTYGEREKTLNETRAGKFPAPALLAQYPELAVVQSLTREKPAQRMTLEKAQAQVHAILIDCLMEKYCEDM